MKQYLVTKVAKIAIHDEIMLGQETISADYMKLENGHLIFRNEVRGSYPNTIRIFAPGTWREVKLV